MQSQVAKNVVCSHEYQPMLAQSTFKPHVQSVSVSLKYSRKVISSLRGYFFIYIKATLNRTEFIAGKSLNQYSCI